jgi:hypothetical protein
MEIRKITVQSHPKGKSLQDPNLTNKKMAVVVSACHPNYARSINKRITVQAWAQM